MKNRFKPRIPSKERNLIRTRLISKAKVDESESRRWVSCLNMNIKSYVVGEDASDVYYSLIFFLLKNAKSLSRPAIASQVPFLAGKN